MARGPMRLRYAVPRVPQTAAPEVAFPQPLTPERRRSDAANFCVPGGRVTFPRQFDRVSDLENPLLLGTVLADRYLGRFHRSTADELSDWLSQF